MKTLLTLLAITLLSACSSVEQYDRCNKFTDKEEIAACRAGVDSEIAVKQGDTELGGNDNIHMPPMQGPNTAQPSSY